MLRTLLTALALTATLGGTAARAHSARLLAPRDVASAVAGTERGLSPEALVAGPSLTTHLAAAMGAGMLAVPASLYLASWVGTLSNSLLGAAVPALLVMGLVAPAVTTLVSYLTGNWGQSGRHAFWGAFGASVLVHVLALVAGGFFGLSVASPVGMAAFALVDGALLGASSTGTMRALARERSSPAVSTLPSRILGETDVFSVPLARTSF